MDDVAAPQQTYDSFDSEISDRLPEFKEAKTKPK